MRRFDQGTNPLGAAVVVNAGDAEVETQARNDVAADASGGFLVVWEDDLPATFSNVVKARKFDGNGDPVAPEFQVNTTPNSGTAYPAVDSDAAGNFVVTWKDYNSPTGVTRGQRLDPSGTPIGGEFEIFPHENDEIPHRITMTANGHFMVVGYERTTSTVQARTFAPDGTPLSAAFVVDPTATPYSWYGTASADADDHFVVVWQNGYGSNLYGQRFDVNGVPDGARFPVGTPPPGFEIVNPGVSLPSVAVDSAGDFTVVWPNLYYLDPPAPGVAGPYESPGIWGRQFAVCGNGRIGRTQTCDDGDTTALDGCSALCQTETCHVCSGAPSSCTAIPACTTVCSDAGQVLNAQLTMKGVGAPLGDESMSFRGKITGADVAGGEYDPSVEGAEIALHGASLLYQHTAPLPIPPGLTGTGCDPLDGWKARGTAPNRTFGYKNVSNAFPPACITGSANGLKSVKFKDRIALDGTLQVKLKVKKGSIASAPPSPVTATIVLGQSPAAGAAGRCARVRFTTQIGTRYFPDTP